MLDKSTLNITHNFSKFFCKFAPTSDISFNPRRNSLKGLNIYPLNKTCLNELFLPKFIMLELYCVCEGDAAKVFDITQSIALKHTPLCKFFT